MTAETESHPKPAADAAVLRYLRKLSRRQMMQTWSALIGGAVLCLFGPLLVTLFFTLISTTIMASYGFAKTYWMITAATLPIFFLVAFFLRGSVLERWVPDGDSLSGRFMRRWVAPIFVILEVANIGPRLVIWAIGRIRGQRRVRGSSRQRIATAIATMLRNASGISPAELLLPGEPADRLESLLGFLLFHQIVDLSSQGDRVWLVSQVRRDLER